MGATLRFCKMHGAGNDFVVLDGRAGLRMPAPAVIRAMGDRHTGIGFDQLLTIESARDGKSAFYYGIWNADGSPSGQCGNGVRCVAAWLHRAGALHIDTPVLLQSPSGVVGVRLLDPVRVAVDMGEPRFAPAQIPFDADVEMDPYPIELGGKNHAIGVVSMGNPHALMVVDDVHSAALDALGPALSSSPRFADGCNAGFAHVLDANHIELRVHERGAGWTRACGSGACAAAAVLQRRGKLGRKVRVDLPGGRLDIEWHGPGHSLWMTGPAAFVYAGEWPRQ